MERFTDELIHRLLKMPKQVNDLQTQKKRRDANERVAYTLSGTDNTEFKLYCRQNYKPGMEDDFSCGLLYLLSDRETLTLIRYNGSSHSHLNKLEGEQLGYVCHIHKATKKYLDAGMKPDKYAEATDRFSTLEEAKRCLVKDCHITGPFSDQLSLLV